MNTRQTQNNIPQSQNKAKDETRKMVFKQISKEAQEGEKKTKHLLHNHKDHIQT